MLLAISTSLLSGPARWLLLMLAGACILAALSMTGVLPRLFRLLLPGSVGSKLSRSFELAVRSLWLHKLRAFLSVLGIIIGTSAVIALMAFGEGSMQDALDDIKRQGATNIIVRSVKPPDDSSTGARNFVADYGIKWRDYGRFTTIDGVTRLVPMRIFPQGFRYQERLHNGRLVGTTPEYAEVNKIEMALGRFLVDDDGRKMKNVCVLAAHTADRLFPYGQAMGETVKIGQHNYEIVGIAKDRMPTGGTGGSQSAEVYNDDIYIPIETCRVRFGDVVFLRQSGSRSGEKVELSQVTLTVDAEIDDEEGRAKVKAVGDLIREMLEKGHYKQDWAVTMPLDKLEEAERAKDRFTTLLAVIALISLVVGGIGIMNIMLATVTERTREIGIRRALGAKRKDITLQFLVEAVVQTTIGGVAGVFIGLVSIYLAPPVYAYFADKALPAKLNVGSIFLSLGFSMAVGVLFGLYPAYRAAKLDPIEALRHE
jgi:putative ABC transport system permease protein